MTSMYVNGILRRTKVSDRVLIEVLHIQMHVLGVSGLNQPNRLRIRESAPQDVRSSLEEPSFSSQPLQLTHSR